MPAESPHVVSRRDFLKNATGIGLVTGAVGSLLVEVFRMEGDKYAAGPTIAAQKQSTQFPTNPMTYEQAEGEIQRFKDQIQMEFPNKSVSDPEAAAVLAMAVGVSAAGAALVVSFENRQRFFPMVGGAEGQLPDPKIDPEFGSIRGSKDEAELIQGLELAFEAARRSPQQAQEINEIIQSFSGKSEAERQALAERVRQLIAEMYSSLEAQPPIEGGAEDAPKRPTLYKMLSARDDWDETLQHLRTFPKKEPHEPLSERDLQTILELVPDIFSMRLARYYYHIAFGRHSMSDEQRAALDNACRVEEGRPFKT